MPRTIRRLMIALIAGSLLVVPWSGASAGTRDRPYILGEVRSDRVSGSATLRGVVLVAEPLSSDYPTVVYKGSDDAGNVVRVASGRLYETKYRLQWFDDTGEHVSISTGTISIREGSNRISAQLPRAWEATGTVKSGAEAPVAGVDVWSSFEGVDGPERVTAKTGADGSFSLVGVPEGVAIRAGYGFDDSFAGQAPGPGGQSSDAFPTASPRVIYVKPKPVLFLSVKPFGKGAVKLVSSVSYRGTDVTGTVAVYDNGKQVIGKTALSADGAVGRYSTFIKKLKPGKHRIRIHYYGSGELRGGDSVTRTVTIK